MMFFASPVRALRNVRNVLEVVRLAGEAAVARRAEIEASLRTVLEPWMRTDGVWAPSSTWIVTATATAP